MCQSKYLNNPIVQDHHRAVKRITRPKLGFKTFRCALVLLAGIEVMQMFRKGQLGAIKDRACVCSEPVLLARFLIGVGLAAMLGLFSLLRQNPVGRGQVFGRHLIGDVLHDGRAFGQSLAVVKLQQGHVAVRVDREVAGAASGNCLVLVGASTASKARPDSHSAMCGLSEQAPGLK